eukprot:gb/GECG01006623.1/.p1 GENE.gb/GECG01006623.1/~~gb/GECG01006623.1/.p1  ORF type:complete len:944 (+),score=123.36 gb/GECG01006623.1/:1-2832(+)
MSRPRKTSSSRGHSQGIDSPSSIASTPIISHEVGRSHGGGSPVKSSAGYEVHGAKQTSRDSNQHPSSRQRRDESATEAEDRLTLDTILQATGAEKPETIQELELIFADIQVIDSLQHCVSLRSLTLIDTGLNSLRNLFPVSNTLLRLCISEQKQLTEIYPPLHLPNLRDLLLHRNNIKRISGLEGCPKLQRLWLQSNRIKQIEGLHSQGDLRELWLQDNEISRISGIEHLVNLQVLALGGNPIRDLRDAQKLSHLPMLRSFSLTDVYFGDCPAVHTQGYRHYLTVALPALSQLDGFPVTPESRKAAEREMLVAATEFAQRVESVTREQEEALASLRAQRARHVREAQNLSSELAVSFEALAQVVRNGEDLVSQEAEHVNGILKRADDELHGDLNTIEEKISSYLTQCAQREERASLQETQVIRALQSRSFVEREENALLAHLSSGSIPAAFRVSSSSPPSTATNTLISSALSEHSPEFRVLSAHFFGDSTAVIEGGNAAAHIQGMAPSQSLLSSIKSRTDGVSRLASPSSLWRLIPSEIRRQMVNTEPYEEDVAQIRKLLGRKTIKWAVHNSSAATDEQNQVYRIVKAWKLYHSVMENRSALFPGNSRNRNSFLRVRLYVCLPRPLLTHVLLYGQLPVTSSSDETQVPLLLFTHAEDAIRMRWLYDYQFQHVDERSSLDESLHSGPNYSGSHCLAVFRAEVNCDKLITCPLCVVSKTGDLDLDQTNARSGSIMSSYFATARQWAHEKDADHVIFPLDVREGSSSIPSIVSLPSYATSNEDGNGLTEGPAIAPEVYTLVASPSSSLGVSTYHHFVDQTLQQIVETVDQGTYLNNPDKHSKAEETESKKEGQSPEHLSNQIPGLEQLRDWEKNVSSSVSKHNQRVLLELNPTASEELESAAEEVVELQEELRSLRDAIDQEKQTQEGLLREQQRYSQSSKSQYEK